MEQNTEERKEAIHPIHGWWISQEKIDTIKGNIRDEILTYLKEGISQKLSEMREHIRQLPQDTFIPVKEVSFVFSTNPAARLLVEDVNRLKLGLAHTYYSHEIDYYYEAGNKVEGMGGLQWGLCSVEQAEHLYKTLHWRIDLEEIISKYKYQKYERSMSKIWLHCQEVEGLVGLTLHGKCAYYEFERGNVCNFGGSSRGVAADLYVSAIPESENSLRYILSEGFTPEEGQDPDFWPVLTLLLSGNLVEL